jgi:integrin alpha 8
LYILSGYSLGFGKITETLLNAYVTGAPKENDMTGTAMVIKVENGDIVEDDQLDFNGDQFGSYFGHAVCVVDLNGDSFDEVIVGAPYYAVESHGSEQGRNNGQITIHRPKTEEDPLKIYGKYLDGYFGMAVAAIGDINRDGYQDIAVGAPGELQGKGRIYIYLGHEFTYITKVAQTIDGSDVSSFTPKFFGYTISGGVDMDNNSYPDVIVGSYASDKVWLLRSRPIITMHARMTFNPRTIDVESRNCSKWSFSQSPVACFKADIKMWYESKVPNVKPPETADVGYNLTLDFNHPSQYRLRFSDNDHSKTDTVQMTYGKKTKLILDIYVTPSIKDKESNFDIKFSYFSPVMAPEIRVPGQLQKLFPLVDNDDLEDEQIITSKISVLKLCENNAVCRPHLVATANLTYINNGSALGNVNFIAAHGYGKYDRPFLKLHIAVENKGESAYDSSVVVTLPDKLRFKQAVIPEGTRVTCHLREKIHADYVGVSHVDCSIGNPVFKNEKKKMDFYLTNLFVGNEGQLEIVVNATRYVYGKTCWLCTCQSVCLSTVCLSICEWTICIVAMETIMTRETTESSMFHSMSEPIQCLVAAGFFHPVRL